nr:ribonuclease H-like domain-containing protein [Tanacetum cinerariifolium]
MFHHPLIFLQIVQLILFIVDSRCTMHMTGNLKLLCNFVKKYLGTLRFGNDQFGPILDYKDLVQGNVTIKMVYYIEGLNHNLFLVGQFCDADLETSSPTPICFLAKASPTQAWLWHRRLSHLNFDTINMLSKKDIMNGLPKFKYVKDQLCSSCELGKANRSTFKTKVIPSSKGWLNLLLMDLCGPMRIESINRKKYILTSDHNRSKLETQDHNNGPSSSTMVPSVSPLVDINAPSLQELDFLFSPLFEEYFTAGNQKHRWTTYHPLEQVLRNPSKPVQTRRLLATDPEMCMFALTVSTAKPKNIKEAMADFAWIKAIRLLRSCLDFCRIRCTQILSNILDGRKMDFINGQLKKEVYVAQPDEFVNPNLFEKVYRLRKALYGLKQAPRAWYNELLNFLMSKGFTKGLWYLKDSGFELTTFSNANHVGCIDTRKITSGGIQFLGDKLVSWMSKKQDCTAMSSGEAEYVMLSANCAQVMCMRTHLMDYGFDYNKIPLYYDFQSAIAISCNLVQTEYQLVDMFTKTLPTDRFQYLVKQIGMRCLTPAELEVLTNESA